MLHDLASYHFGKAIAGFSGAVATAIATPTVASIESIPQWMLDGGVGLAFVGCLVYAVSNLWRANQELQREIRRTLEAQNKALAKELADAQTSRVRLEELVAKRMKDEPPTK